MVCVSSHLTVASAASDFGGTDGIGASSKGIGCSDAAVVSVVSNSEARNLLNKLSKFLLIPLAAYKF